MQLTKQNTPTLKQPQGQVGHQNDAALSTAAGAAVGHCSLHHHRMASSSCGSVTLHPPAASPLAQHVQLSFRGFARPPETWQPAAFCSEAADAYQWLDLVAGTDDGGKSLLATATAGGSLRLMRAGNVRGTVRVHGASILKTLIVSYSSDGELRLPTALSRCVTVTGACGACLDDFLTSEGQLTLDLRVAAGGLLAIGAVPAHYDGSAPRGTLSLTFEPALE